MADWTAIETEVGALLAASGFELVQFQAQTGRGARVTLSIDRVDAPGTVSLDDCVEQSKAVSAYLDGVDPFSGAYRLQVSSPGLDRPLPRLADCARFAGRDAKVKFRREGRTATVMGRLTSVVDDRVIVEVDGEPVEIAWPEVIRAHLVYNWDDEATGENR